MVHFQICQGCWLVKNRGVTQDASNQNEKADVPLAAFTLELHLHYLGIRDGGMGAEGGGRGQLYYKCVCVRGILSAPTSGHQSSQRQASEARFSHRAPDVPPRASQETPGALSAAEQSNPPHPQFWPRCCHLDAPWQGLGVP